MFGSFGPQELLIILIIVLVLFGGKKIPEIMRGIGQGMRELKTAQRSSEDTLKQLTEEAPETEVTAETSDTGHAKEYEG